MSSPPKPTPFDARTGRSRQLWAWGLAILTAQAILTFAWTRSEILPTPPPLSIFPGMIGAWAHSQDGVIEPEVYEMLGPDDILNRTYGDGKKDINLFIVYYRTQHRSHNAHDPKVCLPGAGWNPRISEVVPIDGPSGVFPANYYVVAKGEAEAVVVYWYQTHRRAVAQEQLLRLYRVFDTIQEKRTDMALIRIIVPVSRDRLEATQVAKKFAGEVYPYVLRQFSAVPRSETSGLRTPRTDADAIMTFRGGLTLALP